MKATVQRTAAEEGRDGGEGEIEDGGGGGMENGDGG
jgi:hypothetical protein